MEVLPTELGDDDGVRGDAADVDTVVRQPPARWKLLLASLAVAIGVVGLVWGLMSAQRSPDSSSLPAGLERINPERGSQRVPAQSEITVDLESGFIGELSVDGVAIPTVDVTEIPTPAPGQQAEIPPVAIYEPGTALLRFRPVPGAVFNRWAEGEHEAVLRYWKITDGQGAARTFRWTFRTY